MGILNRLRRLVYIDSYIECCMKSLQYEIFANQLTHLALNSTKKGVSTEKYCKENVIVSLTTYGKRLHDVYLSIESIMQQSLLPNKIVLWLADDCKGEQIPQVLERQKERGLEIEYCEDLRSYKKLIPSLKKYPNDVIITIDDDLLYKHDMIEKLINAYLENPSYIYCNRMHRIRLTSDGRIGKYVDWGMEVGNLDVSPLNFATTGAGTLFPPNCFDKEIFNSEVFMEICETADDVWVKAMSLYSGILCKRVYTHDVRGCEYLVNYQVQDIGLYHDNVVQAKNDKQIKAVFERYNLYDLLNA